MVIQSWNAPRFHLVLLSPDSVRGAADADLTESLGKSAQLWHTSPVHFSTCLPSLRLSIVMAAVAIALACSASSTANAAESAPVSAESAEPRRSDSLAAEIVLRALGLLGVNYRFGGNTVETGLDCSGLVRLVFQEAKGLVLPRRAEEIGRAAQSIDPQQLAPGDLVFFNTLRRSFSHVGIYIGNNQFVHAPSSGGAVRVENMTQSYWAKRFDGARRLILAPTAMSADRGQDQAALERLLRAAQGASPPAQAAP
jgi:cell wall-associated NlpC family hydrolase